MKISKEDPRLTAYALGELTDPKEHNLIEQAIIAQPELQQEIESIRQVGELLVGGFEDEEAPELTEFDRARMSQSPKTEPTRSLVSVLLSWPVAMVATAAVLAILIIPQLKRIKEGESQPQVQPEAYEMVEPAERLQRDLAHTPETTASALSVLPDVKASADVTPAASPILEQKLSNGAVVYSALPQLVVPAVAQDTAPALTPSLDIDVEAPLSYSLGIDSEASAPSIRGMGAASVFERSVTLPEKSGVMPMRKLAKPKAEERPVWHTEKYDPIEESGFRSPLVAPLSTFSIDVDTASYANVRRFLNQGQLPPADAVRIEELINYFGYQDAAPSKPLEEGNDPFAVHMAQSSAPWNGEHRLLRVALKGYEMAWAERPASNLVFLLDVSGSMDSPSKLPLVKEAMYTLTRRLDERDRVAIVVYAGASGLALPSTTANNTETIEHALNNLKAGGSTNGGAGIQLAYKVARDHFIEGGNNRVILCTDGDFNVGQTDRNSLTEIASEQAERGVSLTILGFGMGNYKDDMLEDLSNKGKGSYAYIDSAAEARKVFLQDLASNIFKIAKDVKIQVEFNPEQVQAYRLIGYENRRLKAEDFNNDKKKAGDIGPGHTVVAFYEIVPIGAEFETPGVDALRYQQKGKAKIVPGEVATVKLRYKHPETDTSRLITHTAHSEDMVAFERSSDDFRFGVAVAAFGLKLTGSETIGDFSFREIDKIATGALGTDSGGHRSQFIGLVGKAERLVAGEIPMQNNYLKSAPDRVID